MPDVFVFSAAGGTRGPSTCRGRLWAEGGALAPWMSWKNLLGLTTLEDADLKPQSGRTGGTTALTGASTRMKKTGGGATAPRPHRGEGELGTVTA